MNIFETNEKIYLLSEEIEAIKKNQEESNRNFRINTMTKRKIKKNKSLA